ncbi:MAG: DUF5678 domain-containing protein [candidate division KSB1 bacterium]|nr:DUF5678 domain-containing protein [candidate division KSB1 bacterium]MDZ7302630.1 DUF5678 domain-containing protein [candidate division KSB1 bacterium]MDZ7311531.1 DUF5678 domain-containing protein [candidate division KSB1 bacterium]
MSQTTVEEILTAAQRLPRKERLRLAELLKREPERESEADGTPVPTVETAQESARDRIPASREAEMQWLLDHPDFWDQHRGEHVALWGYEMIAVNKSAKEVYAEARRRGIKYPFVQYLPVHEHEWYLGMSNQPAIEPEQ